MGVWEGGWKEGLRKKYETEIREKAGRQEQMGRMEIGNLEGYMDMNEWEEEELSNRANRLKKGRAAGRDWVWGEMIQELAEENLCRMVVIGGINEVIRKIPSSWREGNMKLIEKCKEPMPGDFRPITVTNVGYRLFWSGVRDRIEEHLKQNGLVKDKSDRVH